MTWEPAGIRPEPELPFRQLAQHLPTPCWISDADGVIVWVNDAWIDYTGKTVESLAAEGLESLHDPQMWPQVRARWTSTRAAGKPDEMAFPLRGRDGRLRPFLTRVVPLPDADGVVTRWLGTNTDITRESAAEARARRFEADVLESEARLRLATEAAGAGVWEWKPLTDEIIYSARARAIYGFRDDQPLSFEMVVAATHPDDYPRTSAQAERALDPAIRDREPYEYRVVRPTGEVRWVLAYGEAVFEPDEQGELRAVRYVGAMQDITERRRAEEAIVASERRLQLALRAGRMAVWHVDSKGELSSSPEMNRLLGLPPDAKPAVADLLGNYLPGELDRIRAAAAAARERGERHFEIEYRYRRPDGEVRWLNARAEARVTPEGRPDGVIGVVMDVTDRKADEERLTFLAGEVDHRANNLMSVVQGTVALSQAKDVDALREVIIGRLHALAFAHQLLSQARWSGADLRRLVEEELLSFSLGDEGGSVRITGPSVALEPQAAQGVAMALHELTTNAAKYGALSSPTGRVEISWQVDAGDRLHLRWVESGGPTVDPPGRRGFGTSVIGRALGGAIGGQSRIDWRREGVVCELEFPLHTGASPYAS